MTAVKSKIRAAAEFLLNPRFLLCFGLGWLVTNGWSYILLAVGGFLGIRWMVAVASAYMAFLWLPFTPEKLVTLLIAIALLRLLFPQDIKTLARLKRLRAAASAKWEEQKAKWKARFQRK